MNLKISSLDHKQIAVVVIIFIIGLTSKIVSLFFLHPLHNEGDEMIYKGLTDQILSGKGYTLQDHFLIKNGLIENNQYNQKVFYHPPGGIFLFSLFKFFFENNGYFVLQLSSYVLFFLGMLIIYYDLFGTSNKTLIFMIMLQTLFSPILCHVTSYFWLDGPLLGFSTLGQAFFIRSLKRNNFYYALTGGFILGYASLIKSTAFLVIPPMIGISLVFLKSSKVQFLKMFSVFIILVAMLNIPWVFYIWMNTGYLMISWPGKPSEVLINSNEYIHHITVIRSPWIYFKMIPFIFYTLNISLIFMFYFRKEKFLLHRGLMLIISIIWILSIHVWFGYCGYSKLLRYVILITPYSILLFYQYLTHFFSSDVASRTVKIILRSLVILFFLLEILQGIEITFSNPYDMLVPIVIWAYPFIDL